FNQDIEATRCGGFFVVCYLGVNQVSTQDFPDSSETRCATNGWYQCSTVAPPIRSLDSSGKLPYHFLMEDIIMPVAISTARLEARISTDLHSMLKRAAELQGRTMTDFVVTAVQDAAQRAIEQAGVIRLSMADQECFAQALLSPPKQTPALKRAFARRSKLLSAE
ncbi:DUF1778 domain-containing protein, partial [Pararhodobacter sp.]|uniref:type II toxin-antitoxin system TacA family antitoxin n=2 Tax=Pseudomonadota TaxID=1224 RepID=UPI002AFFC437